NAGRFRRELHYPLRALEEHLPPLRERTEDRAALISHVLTNFDRRNDRAVAGITAEAIQVLQNYSWPGNVRELAAEIERLVLYTDEGAIIDSKQISPRIHPVVNQTTDDKRPAHLDK